MTDHVRPADRLAPDVSATAVVGIIRDSLPERLVQWKLEIGTYSVEPSGDEWPIVVTVHASAFANDLVVVVEREPYQVDGPNEQANGALNVTCALIDERLNERAEQ